MKVLLTGANGYIGIRLLYELLKQDHEVICAVRSAARLSVPQEIKDQIKIIEIDFLNLKPHQELPQNIDVAYYLIHSMSSSTESFDTMEAESAMNFVQLINSTSCKQIIYLSGIVNEDKLSKHLLSRKRVEDLLYTATAAVTVLRAGIIVGSGSSSFEIVRDLCEKLPLMITPKWVNTKTHPIAIRNVMSYLTGVLGREDCYNHSYDIGGKDVLTYKEMMTRYAKMRKIKLYIITVPIMTPKLSSYWLYFVTSTSYKLAQNLVNSMAIEVVAQPNNLREKLGIQLYSYEEALDMAFAKIEQNQVASSWKDSMVSGRFKLNLNKYKQVPSYGCLKDAQQLKTDDPDAALERIWSIGGKNGYYYATFLWKIRGYVDKLMGGVGLRRGRTNANTIYAGDSLDFWRVLVADKKEKRLLLFAEMRVPGEAWLEFEIDEDDIIHQTATFRPRGIWGGRLYWYSMLPFHYFIFAGMIRRIAKG
ncbi:putative nucleoside-diphosphate-sugar epimerase [Nonlabens ulvanivorans]|uniref:Putative nucleoside-diphosphate-sugar epimerase n=1 Tax=Nonlabens ulvanivorans TaxID=906888 RepID=A0A090WBJ8_NONUL|nr:SDR family oxidoreductase [Nonlabens ulvanivorans]GAL74380.1 putative nucleoside-diphosphate-sugar epimerase [Nonlabens ulvanivorans]